MAVQGKIHTNEMPAEGGTIFKQTKKADIPTPGSVARIRRKTCFLNIIAEKWTKSNAGNDVRYGQDIIVLYDDSITIGGRYSSLKHKRCDTYT